VGASSELFHISLRDIVFLARFNRRLRAANAVKRAAADRFALAILPIIGEISAAGITSLNGIARELRRRNVPRLRAGRWTASTVRSVLFRTIAPEIRAEASRCLPDEPPDEPMSNTI
jgi:hypothetical protein